jgi:photosystem II stability/assembly factor-like uncharacterized protein
MKSIKYLLLIVLVSSTIKIYPQDFWQQTNGPTGGIIRLARTNSQGHIFISKTDINGENISNFSFGTDKLYRSTDDGVTWILLNNGLENQYINKIVFNSQGHIFILSYGIFRSTNNGDTWIQINNGLPTNQFWIDDLIICSSGELLTKGYDGVMFRSTNNGDNWIQVNIGLISSIAISPTGELFVGGIGQIYRSTDNGNSWSANSNGINPSVYIMSISFDSSGIIYGSATSGESDGTLYRSTNNGDSWTVINNGLPLFEYSDKIVINKNNSLFVPIFLSGEVATVYRSTDNGENWLTTPMQTTLSDWNDNLVANSNGDIFCPDNGRGIFRSTDEGANWVEINNGLSLKSANSIHLNDNNKLYVSTNAGIFSSTNNGDNWTNINNNFIHSTINTLLSGSNSKIFAGTFFGGLYRSDDKGNNWAAINNGISFNGFTDGNINDIVENSAGYLFASAGYWESEIYRSSDDGENWEQSLGYSQTNSSYIGSLAVNSDGDVYAGTYAKLMHSEDNGVNWTAINLPFAYEVASVAINPYNHIFVAAYTEGVYRSTDNGVTWSLIGFQNNWMKVLEINSNGIIFAGTEDGLFRSSDNGNNWTQITTFQVRDVTFNKNGLVYVSSDKVYRSTNNGDNWTEISTGLPDAYIHSLAVDADGYIFAGTLNNGVYRSLESTTSVGDDNLISPNTFSLEQNYPNPFNPSTTIRYNIPTVIASETKQSQMVTLKVFDILGNEVATLVNEEKPAGSYEVKFNASGLSSGIYFYKLQAGSLVETKKMTLLR